MRDLRTTTTKARSATGEERATILGELGVDEGRYAAVGVPIPARVHRLLAEPGDRVVAGQVLVELQSVEVGRARAALVAARAHAAREKLAVERKRSLSADLLSAREVEAAEAEAAAADADVAAAEASLVGLGLGGSGDGGALFALRSPVAGVVLAREARRGEIVDPEHTLFEIADVSVLWMTAHAFERDALRIREGDTVEILTAAVPNQPWSGVVARIGQEVETGSRTIPVRIDVPNADGRLRPGMSAQALIPLAGAGGELVVVPSRAPQRISDGWVVFLPVSDGVFEVRSIGRGRDLGDDVEVLSGLRAGEEVVVDGAFLLKAEAEKASGGGDEHHH